MTIQNASVGALESYPTTKPAMRIRAFFKDRHNAGVTHTGSALVAVPLMDGGVIESVGDFEPKFKFKIINGIDFFTVDADQTHGRVDVHCTLADDEGRSARFTGEGVVKLTPEVLALVYSQPDAKTPPFGAAIETFKFQTGHPEYKALENMKFAGSQRFTYEDGVRTGIDIRISQLLSGTGMD